MERTQLFNLFKTKILYHLSYFFSFQKNLFFFMRVQHFLSYHLIFSTVQETVTVTHTVAKSDFIIFPRGGGVRLHFSIRAGHPQLELVTHRHIIRARRVANPDPGLLGRIWIRLSRRSDPGFFFIDGRIRIGVQPILGFATLVRARGMLCSYRAADPAGLYPEPFLYRDRRVERHS